MITKEKIINAIKNKEHISKEELSTIYKTVCKKYLFYDNSNNSYFFSSGNPEFDLLLEEFDNFVFDRINKSDRLGECV